MALTDYPPIWNCKIGVRASGSPGVLVKNIDYETFLYHQYYSAIEIDHSDGVSVQENDLRDEYGYGGPGVIAIDTEQVVIKWNEIRGFRDSIQAGDKRHLVGNVNMKIYGNNLYDAAVAGVDAWDLVASSPDAVIQCNDIRAADYGVYYDADSGPANDFTVGGDANYLNKIQVDATGAWHFYLKNATIGQWNVSKNWSTTDGINGILPLRGGSDYSFFLHTPYETGTFPGWRNCDRSGIP